MSGPAAAPLAEPPRLYPTTNTSYESSSAPSTLSPQSPGGPLPGMALLGPQMMNRPESAGRLHFPQSVHMLPVPDGQGRYGSDYEQMMHQEYRMNRIMAAGDPTVQAQKRVYRQRRKDPSCDACRERKVKCDATDTSSCSECSSRSVKCQFTKETNRRMSSIKQVQDLEKQLLAARQQVTKLQSLVKPDSIAVEEDDETMSPQARPRKRRKTGNNFDNSTIQRNMQIYGRGIFRAPTSIRPRSSPRSPTPSSAELPPKGLGEQLLADYKAWLHQKFPFVDLNALSRQFDDAYRDEALGVSHGESTAVLFGVFACGALRNRPSEGQKFFASLKLLVDFWAATPTLDLIRAMLLSCLFLIETNSTSAAFSMMGHAVRAAQDLGLHLHYRGSSPRTVEEDLKRNLWLTLYCIERALAYQLGRPSMISDEDFDPSIESNKDHEGSQSMSRLERIALVVRTATHLRKAFKSPMISSTVAQAVDVDLNRCMSRLPPRLHLTASEQLTPGETHAVIYLQDIRLLLHRHNLNPSCPAGVRASGINECVSVSKNTARLLSRVVVSYPQQTSGTTTSDFPIPKQATQAMNWEEDMRLSSSTFTCLHVWRCVLFLTACEDFEGALFCALACRAIGKARPINNACGRYFEFFLNFCSDRRRQRRIPLEEDEELIAYLSADLQGNPDQAWIWQDDSETISPSSSTLNKSQLDGENETEWNNWSGVIEELRRLLEEQKPRPPLQQHRSHSSTGSHLAPKVETVGSPTQQQSPSNRMSIADLI